MLKFAAIAGSCMFVLAVIFYAGRTPTSAEPLPLESKKFTPFDTSRLMDLPDAHEVFGVEKAYPHLTFTRPVDVTHSGDSSNRIFVVEQDGRIRVCANEAGTRSQKSNAALGNASCRPHCAGRSAKMDQEIAEAIDALRACAV